PYTTLFRSALVREGGLLPALTHGAQPFKEAAQAAPARGLEAPRQLEQAHEPGPAALAVPQARAQGHAVQPVVERPEQPGQLRIPREVTEASERIEEGPG